MSEMEEGEVVDLTELDSDSLLTIYWKLKQIDDRADFINRDFLAFEHVDEMSRRKDVNKVGPHTALHEQAMRRYQDEKIADPEVIATLLSVSHNKPVAEKEALELILDHVWLKKCSQHMSLHPLLVLNLMEVADITSLREYLSDMATPTLREMIVEFPAKSPSQLEIALTILYAETNVPQLYQDALTFNAKVTMRDIGMDLDVEDIEKIFDEAVQKTQKELEESVHQQFQEKERKQMEEDIMKGQKDFDEFQRAITDMTAFVEKQDQSIIAQKKRMVEENVISSADGDEPSLVYMIPAKYKKLLHTDEEADEIQVVEERSHTSRRQVSKLLPPQLLTLEVGNSCLAKFPAQLGGPEDRWEKAIVQDFRVMSDKLGTREYRVQFTKLLKGNSPYSNYLNMKDVAYGMVTPWRLDEGRRVAALYVDEHFPECNAYYSGTVGEKPGEKNRNRFLIFFDDGAVQYVPNENIRVPLNVNLYGAREGWKDVQDEGQRHFLKSYLEKFPYRNLLQKLVTHERIEVEREGVWFKRGTNTGAATVMGKDCALVKVRFPPPISTEEWMFRGSPRFWLIYSTLHPDLAIRANATPGAGARRAVRQLTQQRRVDMDCFKKTKARGMQTARKSSKRHFSVSSDDSSVILSSGSEYASEEEETYGMQRLVGRKETVVFEPKGTIIKETVPKWHPPTRGTHPVCDSTCSPIETTDLDQYRGKSPILIPLLLGWKRETASPCDTNKVRTRNRKDVFYVGPCGRRLRDPKEISEYLKMIRSSLAVEMFCFDAAVDPLKRYHVQPAFRNYYKEDYAKGAEDIPIPVINTVDKIVPPDITYSKQRFPIDERVVIPNVCSGCSCEDDCANERNCECRKLTKEELDGIKSYKPPKKYHYGYDEGRLTDLVQSGIYECNENCKCSKQCVNRIVQKGMSVPIELFRTQYKGWGIRAVVDIPKGQFVCIYTGAILSNDIADELGAEQGDEYFADMDLIRVVEAAKDGYESEAYQSSDDDMDSLSGSEKETRRKKPTKTTSEDGINIVDENKATNAEGVETEGKHFTLTRYFKEHCIYTIDARRSGNIGRYLNHSCDPNIFVQNVLVDTHDLRFPWTSFFTKKRIPAGEELAWDYNYDIGNVEGKEMVCHCGSKKCRGRLL